MNQQGWNCFLKLCLTTDDEKTLSAILDLFLTLEEKDSLATRCLIIKDLLAEKKTQRKMAEDLQVSIAKITRGSNELKRISPKLKQYLAEIFLN